MAGESLASFRRLGMGYETAKSVAYLAIAHGQQGKVLRALELFSEARQTLVRERNSVWPALIDLYQGLILVTAGRLFEARSSARAALEAFSSSALASKAILCRLSARQQCEEAAQSLEPLDLPALAFQLHYVKGQIDQAEGDSPAAYDSYRRAQGFLETLRSSLRGEELKIAFMRNKLEVYESLVDLALGRRSNGGIEQAFSYVEQAKSRSLQELILRAAAPTAVNAAGKSDLVRRVGELREELNWYYHRIEAEQMAPEERTAERIERLHSEVQAHESELLRVVRELPASETERELLAPVSLPLDSIRAALFPGSMLVEYFRVGQRLLAFLIGPDVLEVVPVALVPRVEHLLRLLQFQLSWARPGMGDGSRGSREALLSATQAHLAELYQELLAPLRGRLEAEHLIFVPHDLLHYVPFHALHDGREHLIDAYSVSYAPSATIYALCHGRATNATGPSLVMGKPAA
jgi:predicted negative regulator of RcsB-dependent stress response